jgi:hypothetical protein
MPAWLTGWAPQWRAFRQGAWLPGAAAISQGALVATVALATIVQTAGYLGRPPGSGRALDDLGAWTMGASVVGFIIAGVAGLLMAPVTWILLSAALRRVETDPVRGPRYRRAVWRRVWWLAAGLFVPPLVGLLAAGQRGLAVPPAFALAEVPLVALAVWALGTSLSISYWMRRICFRVGLAGIAMYFLARRFEVLPRWLTEWPTAGGALSLTSAEAAYLESFTGATMLLGFVALGSIILAARPSLALGPVAATSPPVPTALPPATPLPPTAPPERPVEVALPRHPSGRVMRRLDV